MNPEGKGCSDWAQQLWMLVLESWSGPLLSIAVTMWTAY